MSFAYRHKDQVDNSIENSRKRGSYKSVLKSLGSQAGVMARKLSNALLDRQKVTWHGGYENGRLDSKRLVAAYLSNPMVYKKREDNDALDTAVSILVDLSDSMRGRSIKVAQAGAIALAESLSQTEIPTEVIGFRETDRADTAHGSDPTIKYGRTHRTDMIVFKSFEDSLNSARDFLGCIPEFVEGTTNDTEGVLKAYRRLAVRPEKKKILLALSDGSPSYKTGYFSGVNWDPDSQNRFCAQTLRDAVDYVISKGVYVVGIGILTSSVSKFYPHYAVVHELEELSGAMIDEVAKGLLGITVRTGDAPYTVGRTVKAAA